MRGALVWIAIAATGGGGGCHLVFPIDVQGVDGSEPGVDGAPGDAFSFGGWSAPVRVNIPGHPMGPTFRVTDPSLDGSRSQLAFVEYDATQPGFTQNIWIAPGTPSPTEWGIPTQAGFTDLTRAESNPKLSDDAVVMWISRNIGNGQIDVLAFRRDTPVDTAWSDVTATEASGLSTLDEDRPGSPTAARDRIVIHRHSGTGWSLVEYVRPGGSGAWAPAPGDPLAAINRSFFVLGNGHLADDGRTLVFAAGVGSGLDLYVARRAAVGLPFDSGAPITEVNWPYADSDPWLSPDGRQLWFSREGSPNTEEWGIYYSAR